MRKKGALNFLKIFLTILVLEKLENSIFEMPIFLQTLNINNLKATSAMSINLHTTRKLIEKKRPCEGSVCTYHFRKIAFHR